MSEKGSQETLPSELDFDTMPSAVAIYAPRRDFRRAIHISD
jgi:hypothetical protein